MPSPATRLVTTAVVLLVVVNVGYSQALFVRGDVDGDGEVNLIPDAARLASSLFGGSPPLPCQDAGDIDDNGLLELADLATLLNEFFSPGMNIPAPFPLCGDDTLGPPDPLTCVSYSSCGDLPAPGVPTPDLVLGFSTASGVAGGTVSISVTLDISIGSYAGWSFGVCHDPALATVQAVARGETLLGLSPDFDSQQLSTMGWRTAALLSSTMATTLGPGVDYRLYDVDYDHLGVADSPLTFCENVGPMEDQRVVFATATPSVSVTPTTQVGSLAVPPPPVAGAFIRGDADGNGVVDFSVDAAYLSSALFQAGPALPCADAADFTDDGTLDLADISFMLNFGFEHFPGPVPAPYPTCGPDPTVDALDCLSYVACGGPAPSPLPGGGLMLGFGEAAAAPSGNVEVQVLVSTSTALSGWSLGVCHSPQSASLVSVVPGVDLLGLAPEFESRTTYPGGWTGAVLIRLMGGVTLGPGSDYHLYTATYQPTGAGDPLLRACGGLGDPPVRVTFAGAAGGVVGVSPTVVPGSVIPPTGQYVRGDPNGDSVIDLSDAIFVIAWAFADGAPPPCFRAADANGDQALDIADMIWLVNYLFQNGPRPPAPFPACGFASSTLSCVNYPGCP